MEDQPQLKTERLTLRPLVLTDADQVQRLAGDRDVASTTLNIPHPYPDGAAEKWITSTHTAYLTGEGVTFAITKREGGELMGVISLNFHAKEKSAEMGYWIGKPYWNQGYVTEAAAAVIEYGFMQKGLKRLFARHMTRNPASGRVMQKLGMKYEGRIKDKEQKWGKFEDLDYYAILREEYLK